MAAINRIDTHKRMKQTKTEILYQALKDQLQKMEPGMPFLSNRTIMKRYSVSQATVTLAIQRLCEEELLEKHSGKEPEVTEQVLLYRPDAPPVICLAIPQWNSNWYTSVESMFFALADELGYELKVYPYPWRDGVPRKLPSYKIDHLILLSSVDQINMEQIIALNSLGVPISIFAEFLPGLPFSYVVSDNEYWGNIAANHLIELGHRHLAVVFSEPPGPVIRDRFNGFCKMCELRKVQYTAIDCGIVRGDDPIEKVYRKFQTLLAGPLPEFTGIVTLSCDTVLGILKALYERKLTVPGDFSLLVTGNDRMLDYLYPSITHLDDSLEKLVRAAVAQVLTPNPTGECRSAVLRSEIAVRDSTGAPRETAEKR